MGEDGLFASRSEYEVALLRLLHKLPGGRGRTADVCQQFEDEYGHRIPQEDYGLRSNGRDVIWVNTVRFVRNDLKERGFLDGSQRGIWRITEVGRDWVESNPDAVRIPGTAPRGGSTGSSREPPENRPRKTSPTEAIVSEPVEETQQGTHPFLARKLDMATDYRLALLWQMNWLESASMDSVLSMFEIVMKHLIPSEHYEQNEHGTVKWRYYVAWARYDLTQSGLMGTAEENEWVITQAGKDWLSKIPDLELPSSEEALKLATQLLLDSTHLSSGRNTKEGRQAFLSRVAEQAPQHLPTRGGHGEIRVHREQSRMELVYREFAGAHYELALGRSNDRLAVHFEAARAKNERRLRVFEPHQEELSEKIGHPVVAELWGKHRDRVLVRLPCAARTAEQADDYARILGTFVEATYPLLREAFSLVPAGRQGRNAGQASSASTKSDAQLHTLLDEQLDSIRRFLQGHGVRPSDEVLCDWVQFCYTFGLYAEGHELFTIVDASSVNDWLYRRTKKLAEVCRVRSK
ncbi:MAG: winged helix-turn-helix domain-containing protein [Planctomycetota bacterium]